MIHGSYKNRPVTVPEEVSQIDLVERVGYISAQKQIENLMNAGRQLELYRASQFTQDKQSLNPDDYNIDVTSRKNFDFQEAFALLLHTKNNLQSQYEKSLTDKEQKDNSKPDSEEPPPPQPETEA